MSTSQSLASVRARALSGLCIDKLRTAWALRQWQRPGEPSSCRNRQFLVACPRAHPVRIQARFMSETRLRVSSKTTLRQKTRERAPSTVLAQILHRLSAPESWAPATRWESRLAIDLSIDNAVAAPEVDCLHPVGRTEDALACHRSCHRKPVFRRWPAYLHLRAAILRWRAISVGLGDRQSCPRRSRHSSDGVRDRGTASWRSLQALIHNAAILPPGRTPQTSLTGSVESGMRLFRLNLLGMILLPQGLFLELKTSSVSIVNVTRSAPCRAPVFQHRQCHPRQG